MKLERRIAGLDWPAIEESLDRYGYAVTPALLTPDECAALAALFPEDRLFRSHVDMRRHNFGSGHYKYFARPLPTVVQELRESFYPRLAAVANRWSERLGGPTYPPVLEQFLQECERHGQTRPTPLLLRYVKDDFNCLHQDVYGDVAFPLQLTVALSRPGVDYSGGELLLLEQRPRAQSIGHAITLQQGEVVMFPNQHRPVQGQRGFYRVSLRHGVSRLLSGERCTLGIIFHDAR